MHRTDGGRAERTEWLARGASRLLMAMHARILAEFVLPNGRRVDLMALLPDGRLWAVEARNTIGDLPSDQHRLDCHLWCDCLWYAIPPDFPLALVPGDVGVMVAGLFETHLLRPAPEHSLLPVRRTALAMRFGAEYANHPALRKNAPH